MLTAESQSKGEQEVKAEPETTEKVEPEVEATEPEAEKLKGKRSRAKKEPVTV